MVNRKIVAFVVLLTGVALTLNLLGINAGLPSIEQTRLVFPDLNVLSQLSPVMKAARDEVYATYDKSGNIELSKPYVIPNKTVTVVLNGKKTEIDLIKIHALRSALLHSRFQDEQIIISTFRNIKPAQMNFNPHFFVYGGFYIYSAGLSLKTTELLGLLKVTPEIEYYFYHPLEIAKMFMIPKIWGAVVASLSIPFIFLCGWKLFGLKVGLFAALFMAITPALSVEAHCLKPYAFFLPFTFLSLYFSKQILDTGQKRFYFLSGIFAGLSAGALITTGCILFSSITGHLFLRYDKKPKKQSFSDFNIFLIFIGFLLAFFVTNPYYLLSFSEVKREFTRYFGMYGLQSPFANFLANFLQHSIFEFFKEFGFLLYFFVIAGLILSVIISKREDWLILAAFLPFYIYFCCSSNCVHYDLPAVPFMIILAARFLVWLQEKIRWPIIYKAVFFLLVIATVGNSIFYDIIFLTNKKYLLTAGRWLNSNIPSDSSIGTSEYPAFGYQGFPPFNLLDYRINKGQKPGYYIIIGDDDAHLKDAKFLNEYKVIKEFEHCKTFLDKFYYNYRLYYLNQRIRIYISAKLV